ncbi:MAG TPA: metalloregulator ArsR/SmtB family transcription factor [Candidatus Polarisedimenticolaceae bacterium]|nr:metalloregulator ArsR/SmtB family transcription factor [Candidatus Polarisedimenticolaceae bacterium]
MRANKRTTESLRIHTPAARCDIPCFNARLVARKRSETPGPERLRTVETLFAALADGVRLKIVHALADGGELCVCDVAHVTGNSISAASHHLRKLRDLGILKYRNDGKMAYYSLQDITARKLLAVALAGVPG